MKLVWQTTDLGYPADDVVIKKDFYLIEQLMFPQRLELVASHGLKRECGVGQEEENAKKNRYENIIPGMPAERKLSFDMIKLSTTYTPESIISN